MSFNDIYIDQLYIENDRKTTGANPLTGVSTTPAAASTGGYNWVLQLVNKGTANYTFDPTYRVRFTLVYKRSSDGNFIEGAFYSIGLSGTINGNNGSFYICSNVSGSTIMPSGLSPDITKPVYLPDYQETVGNVITHYAATEIQLLPPWPATVTDIATKVVFDADGIDETTIGQDINPTNQANNTFSVYRRDQGTVPNATFNSNNFEVVQPIASNTLNQSRLNASFTGDPHITTINGEYYKFDYLGAFRLYEDDDLIINGLSELGDATRWEEKQYIRKVFIQYHDKSILIDTGFRGTPAKILENNGFEFTDKELEFNQLAEVNCWQCRKTYNILEKGFINRHRNKYGHKILDPIRNKITIELENFKFEIFNVNEYNLQPCRFNFTKLDNDYSKSKGCLIERKYVGVSILEDIKDTCKMVEIDEKNNNDLVELYSTVEMNVELIDPKFI